MKPGDLVRVSSTAAYDTPIRSLDQTEAIRHYTGWLDDCLAVLLEQRQGGNTTWGWCQILAEDKVCWVKGSSLRVVR